MIDPTPSRIRTAALRALRALLATLPLLAACGGDGTGTDTGGVRGIDDLPLPRGTVAVLHCVAQTATPSVACAAGTAAPGAAGQKNGPRANLHLLGGQGTYVRLASSGTTYNPGTGVFTFNVTVQNLTTLAFATTDGTTRHNAGVRVFFAAPVSATGTGAVTVANETGQATFTAADQDYFQYGGQIGGTDQGELGADGILSTGEASAARLWQLDVPSTVATFSFNLYVAAETPPGAIASAAPQVTSISPATLVPGASATLTGTSFHATPASNAVTIGGVAATVTGGTTTTLNVTVPCALTGSAEVQVTKGGMKGAAFAHPLQGNVRNLAAGQAVVVTDASQVSCNELAAAGGAAVYEVAVYNTNPSPGSATSFAVAGDAAGGAAGGLLAARAPVTPAAPGLTRSGAELAAAERAEARHMELVEMNRREYARLYQRYGAANKLRAPGAPRAAVVPPPASRGFRVVNLNGSDCSSYFAITATRVYYNGKVAIYEDDATPAALKASGNAQMAGYYQKIGDQFNSDMEPVIRDNFGDVLRRDDQTDNNGVMVALFTPVINNNFPGVAGFVVSCDLYPNDEGAGNTNTASNFGEVFYAYQPTVAGTGYASFTPDSWYWSIRATFIHETKHVASYVAHAANGYAFQEVSWLEEGLARHSEELWARGSIYNVGWKANTGYGSAAAPGSLWCDYRQTTPACLTNTRRPSLNVHRHFQGLYTFLASPTDHSPFGATSTGGSSFYASSWSLTRYAIDRYGASDAAFLTALTQASTQGITNLAARAGVTPQQLQGGWALSLFADDYPGLASPSADIQMPTWNLRNIFAGMNSDFPGSFAAFPLVPTALAFGSFAPLTQASISGGGVKYYTFSGTQSAAQLVKLTSTGGGSPSSNLRVAIARLQ